MDQAIIEKQIANDLSLLKKYEGGGIGCGGIDPFFFTSCYTLSGLANNDEYKFLPHFEFDVRGNFTLTRWMHASFSGLRLQPMASLCLQWKLTIKMPRK